MLSGPAACGRRAFLRRLFLAREGGDAARPLVVVFLRGACDGLNTVAPTGDDDYRRLRPTLALPPPDRRAPAGRAPLDAGGGFALHPALAPLHPLWREGRMAAVHAFGSDDDTRSHFEAQDQVEHGAARGQAVSGGWLGRALRARGGDAPCALHAVAFGERLPESLRGAPAAGALRSLDEVRLAVPSGDGASVLRSLEALHAGEGLVPRAGRDALAVLRRVQEIRAGAAPGARYPDDAFARALAETARLLHAGVGLEAACLDLGGFDTHYGQGGVDPGVAGGLAGPLATLAAGLAAFAADLGPRFEETTVLVLSEFGRRAHENTALGTDHGSGGVALLLGGGLAGGRVHGRWPGLRPEDLDDGANLRVTTDYRDLLAEMLERRWGLADAASLFPGLARSPVGAFA